MATAGKKRTLEGFFQTTQPKKPKLEESKSPASNHSTYPWPVPQFPQEIVDILGFAPEEEAQVINDQPDLDLLYFKPYIPKSIAKDVFEFLRSNLFFYRVKYKINRGSFSTDINTPRYTTVFGLDETSKFDENGKPVDAKTGKLIPESKWKWQQPRPIPECLDHLRRITENTTGEKFNFCLVNYYSSGSDSISYHSDDEKFLGPNPAIASFSLGASRDFLMRHRDYRTLEAASKPRKWALESGDMVLMRGSTQSKWHHSIPKRSDKMEKKGNGRINITFRRAMVPGGTENYYQYNVGRNAPYRWDSKLLEMIEVPDALPPK